MMRKKQSLRTKMKMKMKMKKMTAMNFNWFEAKTRGLNDWQKAELKHRWGTMHSVLSSRSRMERQVAGGSRAADTRVRRGERESCQQVRLRAEVELGRALPGAAGPAGLAGSLASRGHSAAWAA